MRKFLVVAAIPFLAFASSGFCQDRVAQLNRVEGQVTVTRSASGKVDTARQLGPRVRNGSVFARDVVTTAASAEAAMVFSDGTLLDLVENTSLAVEAEDLSALAGSAKPEGRKIRVLAGDLLANVVPNPRVATRFETPSGVAAVKGTVLRIRSVRSHEDGGDAGIEIKEGDVDFLFSNGATTSLTTGTEIFAAWSRRGGLRVRLLFSNEPLQLRVGGFAVSMPQATQADQIVEAVIAVDESAGTFTVENTSTSAATDITVTDPNGNQSAVNAGSTSGEFKSESIGDLSTEAASEGEAKSANAGEGDEGSASKDGDETTKTEAAKNSKNRNRRAFESSSYDACASVICECGACSGGTCVGTAGCTGDRFCANGLCVDPCEGFSCQCGSCQNGVCRGTNPGCPVGNTCQDGICIGVQSPTDG